MNPLTNVKNIKKLSARELELGVDTKKSWHAQYKDSAWVFIGGLQYDLTEGDIICVFSQYGEVVNINLVRDGKTGKSRGFAFLCYEDQRSTILAVDNLNSIKLVGRIIRVDHVEEYKVPKMSEEMDEEQRRLALEGCAPKALPEPEPAKSPSPKFSDKEVKRKKVKVKKEKKTKKKRRKKEKSRKKKRRRESLDSESDTETSSSSSSSSSDNSSSEDEDYAKRSHRDGKHSKRRHREHNSSSMRRMDMTIKEEKKDPGYDKYETQYESRNDRNSWKADSRYHHTGIKMERDHWQSDKNRSRERDREYDRDRYHERYRDRERQDGRKNNTDMRRKYEDRSREPHPRSRERDGGRDRYRDHR
ncbi:uncharacterized protein LOC143023551 [Oratosquilla oratoria]|uniref:uncharacterized protein LOC143023551 n=1 Tax=Oratosquilla oratoria TaxID=337810 RepID=UPI003F768020